MSNFVGLMAVCQTGRFEVVELDASDNERLVVRHPSGEVSIPRCKVLKFEPKDQAAISVGDRVTKRYFKGWTGTVKAIESSNTDVLWVLDKYPTLEDISKLQKQDLKNGLRLNRCGEPIHLALAESYEEVEP